MRILAVLPDPIGPDSESERIVLENSGEADVDLAGWMLEDRSGNPIRLSGTLKANETLCVHRTGNLSLNQDGDTVILVAPDDALVGLVEYRGDQVKPGKFIVFEQ